MALVFLFISPHADVLANQGEWTVMLTVSTPYSAVPGGVVFNSLSAGVRNRAADGFDNSTDTVSLLETDDPVQAHFTHGATLEDTNNDGTPEGWTCDNPEAGYNGYHCSLWRDFRGLSEEQRWVIEVISPVNGATITLSWRIEGSPEDLSRLELSLIDLSASPPLPPIELGQAQSYQYTSLHEAGKKYGLRRFEIRMKTKGLFITPPVLPDATVGASYHARISAIGGSPVWHLETGGLPPGMILNPNTGEVTGTPSAIGSYTFTVRGDDPLNGFTSTRQYTLNIHSIPTIVTVALPDGIAGADYSAEMKWEGGSPPYQWKIYGNLPEGVTIQEDSGILSGRLLVPGLYPFTAIIQDVNGATDSKELQIRVIESEDQYAPSPISDLRVIYNTESAVLLAWSAPSDDSLTRTAAVYDLRYREECPSAALLDDDTWETAVQVSGEPRPQAEALQTYTLTGIKPGLNYCFAIRSMDAAGHISPLSNVAGLPFSTSADMSGLTTRDTSLNLRKGYNLISLPMIPLPNQRALLFDPLLGNPAALYRWYSAYPGITPPQYYLEESVNPGSGYLLYAPADTRIDISGLIVTEKEYRLSLQAGWNMIGTPYEISIALKDLTVRDYTGKTEMSYINAVKNGWIGNTLYYLRDVGYDFASFNDDSPAVLEPWMGYWIYVGAEGGADIIFRRP